MFNKYIKEDIDLLFENRIKKLNGYEKDLILKISSLTENEAFCMKYFYSTMPLSDTLDYSFNTYLCFVKHSLKIYSKISYCKEIPMEIFLEHILYYRIKNEPIEDCRDFFYHQVYELVTDKNIVNTVLEINKWCSKYVRYEISNPRTSSPICVFKRGYGNYCEQTIFVINVLRSIGIPARQIFAPKWSHDDGDRYWIEVYINGEWQYISACEPEPILNMISFKESASRAMFIYSRVFGKSFSFEENQYLENGSIFINQLKRYANTQTVLLKIVDTDNLPLENAIITLQLLNSAQFANILTLKTDINGEVAFLTNFGSLYLNIRYIDTTIDKLIDTTNKNNFTIVFYSDEKELEQFVFIAPKPRNDLSTKLTQQQLQLRDNILNECKNAQLTREQRKIDSRKKDIEVFSNKVRKIDMEKIFNVLENSKENLDQITNFISNNRRPYFLDILYALNKKDYTDVTYKTLTSNLQDCPPKNENLKHRTQVLYVYSPRIFYENLVSYRNFINHYFTITQKELFLSNSFEIWEYIENNIKTYVDDKYLQLYSSPMTTLRLGRATEISKKILFVAIARTIGVPARISYKYFDVEHFKVKRFVPVVERPLKKLILFLERASNVEWIYKKNWSLAILKNGHYETIIFDRKQKSFSKMKLRLGKYRLITANRNENGNISTKIYKFELMYQYVELRIDLCSLN